ncbi:TetR/AcrR family transcriptional regulator [Desulfopila inferna]|nr:TetR/AcrR family transcriptional regulator [Desulfopila inferna]
MKYSDFSKSERTRLYIIEKSATIFNKKGYAATSLSDITSATGMTKGSIYGNFTDKNEVAISAFEYNAEFIQKCLKSDIQSAVTSLEKLLAYPKTFKRIYRAVLNNGGCPLLNTSVDAHDLNRKLHQAVLTRIRRWEASMAGFIAKGVEEGELKANIDATKIAQISIVLVEGGYAMAKVTGEESFIVNAIAELERMFLSLKK